MNEQIDLEIAWKQWTPERNEETKNAEGNTNAHR